MSEDLKHTPEILSAKDLQEMGFSRSMSYALFNREDVPVIRIGKRKFIRREKFLEWLTEQERTDREWNRYRDGKFIWSDMVKRDVDACILQAASFDSFLSLILTLP